jgi:murein DD-endopeptidase MepM/ murein hydrolase activator NlpD
MSRKFYTIFILPHAQARFRKLHLSRNFILTVAGILGLVVVASAVTPHLVLKLRSQASYLQQLEEENTKLRTEKVRFEASLSQIGEQLDAFESLAGKLAQAVGVKDTPTSRPAGGQGLANPGQPAFQGMLDEELGALTARAEILDESLTKLDEAWQARVRLLATTPSMMPVEGFFSDGFGWRNDPFTGEREFHKGIDIVAVTGTEVRATADAVVTAAGRMAGYGKMVHLSHGYGMGTRYGHLSEILVRPGQRVKRGDVIGRVGSTGRSSGPHLHYEVFKGARQVAPLRYLREPLG